MSLATNEDTCWICLQPQAGDPSTAEEMTAQFLKCGHWLHAVCAEECMEMNHHTSLMDIKCGHCKHTGHEINVMAERLDRPALETASNVIPVENDAAAAASTDAPVIVAEDQASEESGTAAAAAAAEPETQTENFGSATPTDVVPYDNADSNRVSVKTTLVSAFPTPVHNGLTFWCGDCRMQCDISRAKRLMSKTKQTFRCDKCNTSHATLYRGFGRWPSQEFQGLSEDVQAKFYADVQGMRATQIMEKAAQIVRQYEVREQTYADNGEYRPLGDWAVQGYDVDRIQREARPTDIKECRMAGTCYRVPVESSSMRTTFGMDRTDERKAFTSAMPIQRVAKTRRLQPLQLEDATREPPAEPEAAVSTEKPPEDSDADAEDVDEAAASAAVDEGGSNKESSNSSSSSSKSSSSSSDKKNKKKKGKKKKKSKSKQRKMQTKKERAAAKKKQKLLDWKKKCEAEKQRIKQEKQEKAKKALQDKQDKLLLATKAKAKAAATKNAATALEKTEQIYSNLRLTEASPIFQQLPSMLTTQFAKAYDSIRAIRNAAVAFTEGNVDESDMCRNS